jgi:hypothetical protein
MIYPLIGLLIKMRELLDKMKAICEGFGLSEMLLKNGENVIMAAP